MKLYYSNLALILYLGFWSFTSQSQDRNDNITILGVGDIMLGTNFPSKRYLPENCNILISGIQDITRNADITFGNLEGCISNNASLQKRCKDPKKCYAFRMPTKFISCISSLGIDVLSIANNHIWDFGIDGVNETKHSLDSAKIKYAGIINNPYTIFEKDSIIYGFCAFSPNKGTVSIHDLKNAKKIISYLDDTCNIVIASFHGGAEGKNHQHVTREAEIYLGENRGNVYQFAHSLIDAGADIIFGHGPHVTRSIDLYKDRFIIYSLGNFCTYGRFNLSGVNGFAPIIKISTNIKGEFLHGKITPIKQVESGIVKIDEKKQAIKKIQELLNSDFPESKIQIDNDGNITKNLKE